MNIAVILSLLSVSCLSQVTGQYTYQANEFFAAFPKNGNFITLQTLKLHITSTEDTPVLVTITTLLNIQYTIIVQPHTSVSEDINNDLLIQSNTDTNKGIRIKAETGKLISVYATNYVITAAAGYAVLPLHKYNIPEYVYYAFSTSTNNMANDIDSIIVLLSGTNDTKVTIMPTQDVTIPADLTHNGSFVLTAGSTYTVTLNAMQTLLLSNKNDLTGTKIASNKPLSVISGHECGIVSPIEDYCDHMLQQVPPSVTWGRQYMAMPFAKRQSGALFKIITDRSNNEVNVTCNNVTSNEHSMATLDLPANGDIKTYITTKDQWCSFVSKEPTMIAQYAFGGLQESFGDPLSMVLNPIEQYTDLRLHDVITPESVLADSHSTQIEQVIGIFVFGDEQPENITLDGTTELDEHNWRAIYNGEDVLGYGLAIEDITDLSHIVSGSLLSSKLLTSVIVYGFSTELNGFGFPANGGLEPISKPWLITFDQDSYNVTENTVYHIPIISSNPSMDTSLTLTIQTCPGSQTLSNVIFDNTVTFNPGDVTQYVTFTAIDDKNIEELESMCLELTTLPNSLFYLYPITQANIIIMDDDGVQISLNEAKVINNELELTLQLIGYEGENNTSVTVTTEIADNVNGISQSLTPFEIHFTKYLSEIKYLLPLDNTFIVTHDSMVTITLVNTELNVGIGINTLPVLPQDPIPSTTTTTSYTSTSEMTQQSTNILQSTTTVTPIITQTTSSIATNTEEGGLSTLTIEPVTTMVGHSGTVMVDLYVVYLIVGLISVLGIVVLILIVTIICFYKINQKRYQVYDVEKSRGLKKNTQSTTELLGTETQMQPNLHSRYSQDSAYTSSFSRSASPNRSDSPGSDETIEPDKIHHLQRLNDVVDDSSPRHSMAGSKDNLLQQNTPV